MTATTTSDAPPGGGPLPRWSPRRWAHHHYLWWAGAIVLAAVVAAIAVGLDTSPEPGLADDGAVIVSTLVLLLSPLLVGGLATSLFLAVRRRSHDDVRVHGVGQPVRSEVPPAGPPGAPPPEEVLLRVEVDRVPDAARVVERDARGGRHRWIESAGERLRLRSGRGTLTATGSDGEVRHRAVRHPLAGPFHARWEIEVDGRELRCEVRGLQDPPRRTLLEPDGTAWLLRTGAPSLVDRYRASYVQRLRPHGRLPEDLAPDAAAFVLWLVCELEDHLTRVRSYGREGGGMAHDEVADAWAGRPAETEPEEARA